MRGGHISRHIDELAERKRSIKQLAAQRDYLLMLRIPPIMVGLYSIEKKF